VVVGGGFGVVVDFGVVVGGCVGFGVVVGVGFGVVPVGGLVLVV